MNKCRYAKKVACSVCWYMNTFWYITQKLTSEFLTNLAYSSVINTLMCVQNLVKIGSLVSKLIMGKKANELPTDGLTD